MIQFTLKFAPRGPIDDKSALMQIPSDTEHANKLNVCLFYINSSECVRPSAN